MNLNEKTTSPDFLAKLSKKVLRDVPGAEIISDDVAVQKDQERHHQDLDEMGSVFPSFPIEPVIRKTKQEKDRIELKQDLKKIDKQNKKTFDKISKINASYKNSITSIVDSKKRSRNSQLNIDSKRRKITFVSDTSKTDPKTKVDSFEKLSVDTKKRKQKHSFDQSRLNNTKQDPMLNAQKLRKSKYSKKTFDVTTDFGHSQKRNEKTYIKPGIINTDFLFDMDIDSFGVFGSGHTRDIENWNDFELDFMQLSKKNYDKILDPKMFQNSKRKTLEKFFNKNKNTARIENFKKYENLNSTIKYDDHFLMDNKLEFG